MKRIEAQRIKSSIFKPIVHFSSPYVIHSSKRITAFLYHNPITTAHTLIVPNLSYRSWFEIVPSSLLLSHHFTDY